MVRLGASRPKRLPSRLETIPKRTTAILRALGMRQIVPSKHDRGYYSVLVLDDDAVVEHAEPFCMGDSLWLEACKVVTAQETGRSRPPTHIPSPRRSSGR